MATKKQAPAAKPEKSPKAKLKKERAVKAFRGFRAAERIERQIERLREKSPMEDKVAAREWLKFTNALRGTLAALEMDVQDVIGPMTIKEVVKKERAEESED